MSNEQKLAERFPSMRDAPVPLEAVHRAKRDAEPMNGSSGSHIDSASPPSVRDNSSVRDNPPVDPLAALKASRCMTLTSRGVTLVDAVKPPWRREPPSGRRWRTGTGRSRSRHRNKPSGITSIRAKPTAPAQGGGRSGRLLSGDHLHR